MNQLSLTNPHEKCFRRDKAILENLEKYKVLNTDQIQKLLFSNVKSGDRIVRRRLQNLRNSKKIYSNRLSYNEPAYHFIDRKYKNHPQIEHILLTNWIYLHFKYNPKPSQIPFFFQHEYAYPTLRADGLLGMYNTTAKNKIFYFLESDLSNNPFDKITKYNTLFENFHEWENDWWAKETDGFAAILIVTHRKNHVLNKISIENRNNLFFEVYDIDQIKNAP